MELGYAGVASVTVCLLGIGCVADTRHEPIPEPLVFQQLPTHTLRVVPEADSNLSPAQREEIDLVRQGMLNSIALRFSGQDATVSSKEGEAAGLIGHGQIEVASLVGEPISEAVITQDLSTIQYLSSKLATKHLTTCMVLYGISRQGGTVLHRKIRCE